jgi:hypothetical protein
MSTIISNGPSKLDLIMSLANCYSKEQRHYVKFEEQSENGDKERRKYVIMGMSVEDGSGESWNLEAVRVDADEKTVGGIKHIYYHSGRRYGTITD